MGVPKQGPPDARADEFWEAVAGLNAAAGRLAAQQIAPGMRRMAQAEFRTHARALARMGLGAVPDGEVENRITEIIGSLERKT